MDENARPSWSVRPIAQAEEWEAAMDLRWRVLRAPWHQPRGSERDPLDLVAVHRVAADADGRVIGVGRLHRRSHDEAQARFMAVDEAWRGRGIGQAILAALESAAGELGDGIRRVLLEARVEAVSFYLRAGYHVIAPGKVMFGSVRHVVMVKSLALPESESPAETGPVAQG